MWLNNRSERRRIWLSVVVLIVERLAAIFNFLSFASVWLCLLTLLVGSLSYNPNFFELNSNSQKQNYDVYSKPDRFSQAGTCIFWVYLFIRKSRIRYELKSRIFFAKNHFLKEVYTIYLRCRILKTFSPSFSILLKYSKSK